jgi:hypothetical protein
VVWRGAKRRAFLRLYRLRCNGLRFIGKTDGYNGSPPPSFWWFGVVVAAPFFVSKALLGVLLTHNTPQHALNIIFRWRVRLICPYCLGVLP